MWRHFKGGENSKCGNILRNTVITMLDVFFLVVVEDYLKGFPVTTCTLYFIDKPWKLYYVYALIMRAQDN